MLSVQVNNLNWCDVMLCCDDTRPKLKLHRVAIGFGETGFKKRKRRQKTNRTGISEFWSFSMFYMGEL